MFARLEWRCLTASEGMTPAPNLSKFRVQSKEPTCSDGVGETD
jgi:hypothetical protein